MPTAAADLSLLTTRFHALSDETRLRIIDLLRGGERCVCDLTDALDAGQSRLSFHLKVLKDAGWIQGSIDGPRVCYCARPETGRKFLELAQALAAREEEGETS